MTNEAIERLSTITHALNDLNLYDAKLVLGFASKVVMPAEPIADFQAVRAVVQRKPESKAVAALAEK